jgi:uncharacterized protein (TIGR00255 family)
MTGFGEARHQSDTLSVAIELRSINNRYLKVSIRTSELYNLLEPEIEKAIRRRIKRGTLQVQLRVRRQAAVEDYQLNTVAIRAYLDQLRPLAKEMGLGEGGQTLAPILAIPGVVVEPDPADLDPAADWNLIGTVLEQALDKLQAMRLEEGKAMEQELLGLVDHIDHELELVRARAPKVVEDYRTKLHERVGQLVRDLGVSVEQEDLIKEVAIFAERGDVTEEIVRLASHLVQFRDVVREPESPGRKLDFVTQEMFREANTIGSKANDVAIARHVVEIKGAIEKIRELVQNVE